MSEQSIILNEHPVEGYSLRRGMKPVLYRMDFGRHKTADKSAETGNYDTVVHEEQVPDIFIDPHRDCVRC